jgi:hypothetical protein
LNGWLRSCCMWEASACDGSESSTNAIPAAAAVAAGQRAGFRPRFIPQLLGLTLHRAMPAVMLW